ncbi:DegT/DnrJ/EryC1/StrS family aminotransferase [Glacieibacterium sp.]|uniref:DegT/DnrJ/EryC1/StrS family aminotransferase n=1 Tax=Glacieibacterium sp. TaxID=2860237 RepID=UPI003AFF9C29
MSVVALARVADAPPRSRWPVYAEDEIAAAAEVLRSGRVNALHHGEQCRAFEAAYAQACGMPHAIAVANGTVSLEIALRALGIGPGDEVVVTPRSFVASASCVVSVGATPVFADVDPVSQNLTAASVAAVIGPRTRAILVVHLAGWPAGMNELVALAEANDLKIIEDCAQAHGATLDGRPVGSFGDVASFSFCTDKIISTGGEGGLLLFRDDEVHARAWSLKDHGKQLGVMAPPGPSFRWLHDSFGSNLRMTEFQAAIGRHQLAKLPGWTAVRQRNARVLDRQLADLAALRLTVPGDGIGHAYYKYYAFVRPERLRAGWSRDRIVAAAQDAGLPCQSGVCPEIYRERAFVAAGLAPPAPLPVAAELGLTSLMLPVDQTLDADDMAVIATGLATIVAGATA